jgi:hypothetical protein
MKKVTKTALQADLRFPTALDTTLTVRDLSNREEFANEICQLWSLAQQQFIAIGRYLEQAKHKLPHGEYEAMVERDLPFDASIARRLRTVVQFIDSGAVPIGQLPPSYSVLYELASMTPDERERADEAKLDRPDVTRKELVIFKRRLRTSISDPESSQDNHAELQARLERLRAERARIDREIAAIEQQLAIKEQ